MLSLKKLGIPKGFTPVKFREMLSIYKIRRKRGGFRSKKAVSTILKNRPIVINLKIDQNEMISNFFKNFVLQSN